MMKRTLSIVPVVLLILMLCSGFASAEDRVVVRSRISFFPSMLRHSCA